MKQTVEIIPNKPADAPVIIDFQTHPDRYKHWKLTITPPLAKLEMDVAEDGAMFEGYQLKLNSYDIGVDIELYDAIQRLRLEHPEVKTVVISSARLNMFCTHCSPVIGRHFPFRSGSMRR